MSGDKPNGVDQPDVLLRDSVKEIATEFIAKLHEIGAIRMGGIVYMRDPMELAPKLIEFPHPHKIKDQIIRDLGDEAGDELKGGINHFFNVELREGLEKMKEVWEALDRFSEQFADSVYGKINDWNVTSALNQPFIERPLVCVKNYISQLKEYYPDRASKMETWLRTGGEDKFRAVAVRDLVNNRLAYPKDRS